MAILDRIVIRNFRNIELQELEFSPNLNCISGGNGEGKTNLLDAIYYLSMTKSAFATADKFNFRHDTSEFSLFGTYSMPNGTSSKFTVQVNSSGQKSFKRDDKPYQKVSEHIGVLPVVLISPSDISLVSESGEDRRRFVNAVLSQMDREYLSDMQSYTRLLTQRNTMLKNGVADALLLDTLDSMMSAVAQRIHDRRKSFAADLEPLVQDYCLMLSGGREKVSISYKSDIDAAPLAEVLRACRDKDAALKYTTAGIQRDDFIFCMDGYPIRRCGSQGQQKSFVVALKFAQYDIMKRMTGVAPILLMDDLFDKLDMGRVQNLLEMVSGSDFGQIFLTDSNKVRISGIVDKLTADRTYINTAAGTFTKVNGEK